MQKNPEIHSLIKMADIKKLPGKFIDIGVASIFGVTSIGIISQQSAIPSPIRTGTGALIGVGLLKGAGKLLL